MSKKIVLIQGAFDILNAGHVMAFRKCTTLGDHVIVALNTDQLYKVYKGKGKGPIVPYRQRKQIIESIRYIDQVVPAMQFSPFNLLKKYDVDVYVYTKEWEKTKEFEIAYMKRNGKKVFVCPRYKNAYCTSLIKQRIIERHKTSKKGG